MNMIARNAFGGSLTRRGLLCSIAFPAGWLFLFYALVLHTRLALEGWPEFGQRFTGLLHIHERTVWLGITALVLSLYVAGALFVVGLFLPRRRHLSMYAFLYAAAIGIVFALVFLAPGPFLNWFFD